MVDTVESCSAGMRNSSELQCTEAPEFALAMRLQRQGNKQAETRSYNRSVGPPCAQQRKRWMSLASASGRPRCSNLE